MKNAAILIIRSYGLSLDTIELAESTASGSPEGGLECMPTESIDSVVNIKVNIILVPASESKTSTYQEDN